MNLLHYLVSKRLQLVPMTSKITLKPVKKKNTISISTGRSFTCLDENKIFHFALNYHRRGTLFIVSTKAKTSFISQFFCIFTGHTFVSGVTLHPQVSGLCSCLAS